MIDPQTTTNDNAIRFSNLCAALGEDEDAVLRRLTEILSRRSSHEDASDRHEGLTGPR